METNGGGTGEPRKKSKIRRAWSIYRWFDRIRGWSDRYQWLSSLLQTKAGTAVAVGSAAAVTTATAVVVHNVLVTGLPPPPPPAPVEMAAPKPEPEPVRQTQGTLIFAIEGKDTAGRKGTFDVVVAKKEFLWVRGSSDEIEKEGKVITSADVATQVLDAESRAGLEDAKEIIAVGTASQEGDAREETERARQRARRTAELVASGIDAKIPISTLNLGQYRDPCKDCETGGTDWQRPFMVIAVKELEDGANLSEALTDAMTGKSKLPSPKSYSVFELTKFR